LRPGASGCERPCGGDEESAFCHGGRDLSFVDVTNGMRRAWSSSAFVDGPVHIPSGAWDPRVSVRNFALQVPVGWAAARVMERERIWDRVRPRRGGSPSARPARIGQGQRSGGAAQARGAGGYQNRHHGRLRSRWWSGRVSSWSRRLAAAPKRSAGSGLASGDARSGRPVSCAACGPRSGGEAGTVAEPDMRSIVPSGLRHGRDALRGFVGNRSRRACPMSQCIRVASSAASRTPVNDALPPRPVPPYR